MENKLTIICPIHEWNEDVSFYTDEMIKSLVNSTHQEYDLLFISKIDIKNNITKFVKKKWLDGHNTKFIKYDDDLNYQEVINYSQRFVNTPYFMVLEFDDTIHNNYLSTLNNHILHYKDNIDVYMNIVFEVNANNEQLGMRNDYAWVVNAMDTIGYLSFNAVKNNFGPFSLVGAVINKDFYEKIKGLKNKLEVSFNSEFILRGLNNGGVFYVIPQIGIKHTNGRKNSYFMQCAEKYTTEEKNNFYKIALERCYFIEDNLYNN